MTAKTPKALLLIAILALTGAALIAGCGGGSSSSSSSTAESSPPAEEEAMKEEGGTGGAEAGKSEKMEGGGAEAGGREMIAEGKEVFSANCASCHTLSAANAKGTVGPNLDELMPSEAEVEKQVVNGGGPMPAFGKEEILAPNEIEAVAAFVSTVAGK